MHNQTCKQRVANPAAKKSAECYLFALAPVLACIYFAWGIAA